jgi:hypothetical protein
MYTVKNMKTGRSYQVETTGQSMEMVWKSQMYWFNKGDKVAITDIDGNTKHFIK